MSDATESPPRITYRRGTPVDDEGRLAVTRLGWESGYTGIFTDSEIELGLRDPSQVKASWDEGQLAAYFVADAEGTIVGVADLMILRNGDALVEPMHVVPAFQGKGVGTALWNLCLAEARSIGAAVLRVWVVERNRRAVAFYEGRGGRSVETTGFLQIGEHVEPVTQYRYDLHEVGLS